MPQPEPRLRGADVSDRPTAYPKADLVSTAQYLVFEPGVYAVEFSALQSVESLVGLSLPCARLEAAPLRSGAGQAWVLSGVATGTQGGWLSRNGDSAVVLVIGGAAGLVLTTYKASEAMLAPQLHVRPLANPAMGFAAAPPPPPPGALLAPPPSAPTAAAAEAGNATSVRLTLLAHIGGYGDTQTINGWAGRPESGAAIEGFSVSADGAISSEQLEYQAVLGPNWDTPWTQGGAFCGSRGLAVPLLGLRVRLRGAAAESHRCTIWGRFVGEDLVGPVVDGESCVDGTAALEAFWIAITPRTATKFPDQETQSDEGPLELPATEAAQQDETPGLGQVWRSAGRGPDRGSTDISLHAHLPPDPPKSDFNQPAIQPSAV